MDGPGPRWWPAGEGPYGWSRPDDPQRSPREDAVSGPTQVQGMGDDVREHSEGHLLAQELVQVGVEFVMALHELPEELDQLGPTGSSGWLAATSSRISTSTIR